MRRTKKGQQALEYLVTYGWAFIVILITIGAFAYFGVLNPQKYLPNHCDFGMQLQCVDYLLCADDDPANQGNVQLTFLNSFGENIEIHDIEVADGGGRYCTYDSLPGECTLTNAYVLVAEGAQLSADAEEIVLDLDGTDYELAVGDKTVVPVKITFAREDPDGGGSGVDPPEHYIIGEVFAAGQECS